MPQLKSTKQLKKWVSNFGKEYTERNEISLSESEEITKSRIGQTMQESFIEMLGGLEISNILEVGCNIGLNLENLSTIGNWDLHGLEPQTFAIDKAKKKYPKIKFVEGNAFDIPYEDNTFDLVFTSGVLIHISPKDLPNALSEIHRVSRRFIMGFEYYSPKIETVNYRGDDEMLWKMDFESAYLKQFPDIKTIKSKIMDYKEKDGRRLNDIHFLLSKI